MLMEILLVLIPLFITIYIANSYKSNKNLPPGPWSFPILGHLPYLGRNPAVKFMQWKKIYGPVFSIKFGSIPVIVLNEVKLIKEAMNLDALYARPRLANFIGMSQDKGIVMSNGKTNVEQRKFAVDSFKELGVVRSKMEFSMQEEMGIFLSNLSKKCQNQTKKGNKETVSGNSVQMKIKHLFEYPVINSLWVVMTSKRFEEKSETLGDFRDLLAKISDTSTSIMAQLSWFFPWLSSALIFFGLNEVVNSFRRIQSRMAELIEDQRADYVPGQPKNFTHAYFDKVAQTLDPKSSFHQSREEHQVTTTDIFNAAIETTTTSLDWLLLHLARDEQVQRKLQAEIDSIVGSSDPPSCTHRLRMPYTEAIIHELFRISSVVPLGLFRRALKDIDFHGYRIPKGTMVVANQFGVHHDPDVWDEPEKFKPERFLTDNGRLNKLHTDLVPFGYGNRICIGESFARDEHFIFTTSFFQKFSVKCTNEIPSVEGDFGLVILPKPFELVITERCSGD